MKERKALTRSILENLGVVCVSGDGKHILLKNGKEALHCTIKGPVGKYSGNHLEYDAICLYDPSSAKRYKDVKRKYVCKDGSVTEYVSHEKVGYSKNIPTNRVVYAWFHQIVPGDMDVDHINGNTMDNSVDNLQLLTRSENLRKRGGCKNQYDCINMKKFGSVEAFNNYKTELKEAKDTVEYLKGVFNTRKKNYDYAISQWHMHTGDKWYKENKDKYRELMLTAKDRWHSAVKRYNELRDKTR